MIGLARRAWPLAAAALLALVAWVAWIRPRRVCIRRVELALTGWPQALDGLTVAVVSDLHAGAPHVDAAKVHRLAAAVSKTEPDLVVLLGDYVDDEIAFGDEVAAEPVAQALGSLKAPLGEYCILGNNDREYGAERVAAALRHAGLRVLEEEHAVVEARGARLAVVGLRESGAPAAAGGEVAEADARIALAHSPDVFPQVPDGVALTLAGHTHGGQVDLPLLDERIIPSRFGARYKAGLIEEGGRHLFVSAGVGTSRLPIRFRAAPEVPVLTLRSGAKRP